MPPPAFAADSDASATPSIAPSAAAPAPIDDRKPGSAAVAISWPVSERRLPSPIPTTVRLRSTWSSGRRARRRSSLIGRSERGESEAGAGRERGEHEAGEHVARRGAEGTLLREPHRLVGERRERRVGAAEAGAEDGLGRGRERVVEGEAGEHAEEERAAHVDH